MVCVGERFGGLDCEINQSSTSNQKRLESALRDDDVKYQRFAVRYDFSGSNGEMKPDRENLPQTTQREFPPTHTHMATSSRKHQEIH